MVKNIKVAAIFILQALKFCFFVFYFKKVMIEKIVEWDQELFLFLNSKHHTWLDPIMLAVSSYTGWILVCLVFVTAIYFTSKSGKITAVIAFLLSVGMSALLTNLVKLMVARPRPIHNEVWKDTIHAIEAYSTSTSFFSSHSSTTFTMAVFFFLFVINHKLHKIYGYLAIIWATLVAYSRIYLAKHYPVDVTVGILFGILMGFAGYKLYGYYTEKKGLSPNK